MSRVFDYLYKAWGSPVRDEGLEKVWVCPFPGCPDTSGHFGVRVGETGRPVGFCYRCQRPSSGDLYSVLAELEGVSRDTVIEKIGDLDNLQLEGRALLALLGDDEDGLELPESEPVPEPEPEPEEPPQVHDRTFELWNQQFQDILDPPTLLGLKAQRYLFSRGVTPEQISRYNIRYAEQGLGVGSDVWHDHPKKPGKKLPPLQHRMHARIMLPVVMNGQVVYYQGRTLVGAEPRYMNPHKGIDTPMSAGECLFGWHECLGHKRVVLVEGPMDQINIGPGCMALMGHGMSNTRLDLILATGAKEVVLFFDGNLSRPERVELYNFVSRRVRTLWTEPDPRSGHKDAGDMGQEEIRSTLAAAREMDELYRLGLD